MFFCSFTDLESLSIWLLYSFARFSNCVWFLQVALVYGQMNEPPGARARVALTGLTVAEYFRDQEGQDVLLFIDNIFRFTQAGSEVRKLRESDSFDLSMEWWKWGWTCRQLKSCVLTFFLFKVSALLGRIPSAVGYQPTLATDMGTMQERITTTKKGSITSVQVRTVEWKKV